MFGSTDPWSPHPSDPCASSLIAFEAPLKVQRLQSTRRYASDDPTALRAEELRSLAAARSSPRPSDRRLQAICNRVSHSSNSPLVRHVEPLNMYIVWVR